MIGGRSQETGERRSEVTMDLASCLLSFLNFAYSGSWLLPPISCLLLFRQGDWLKSVFALLFFLDVKLSE